GGDGGSGGLGPPVGQAVELAKVGAVADIAVEDGVVYVLEQGSGSSVSDGALRKIATVGGQLQTLAAGLAAPRKPGLRGRDIYGTNQGVDGMFTSGSVQRAALDGSSPSTIASGRPGPRGIAVDDLNVVWSDLEGLIVAPIGGGAPVSIDATQSAASRCLALGGS